MTLIDAPAWATLDADAKRERVLAVAGELFAREGLDVSMPALAEAIGVGVGSIYRQIGRKEDILAALMAARAERVATDLEAALGAPDPWTGLCDATYALVEQCVHDSVMQEAWAASSMHPVVVPVRRRTAAALDALVERARAAGALHEDAAADDLRIVFRAVHDAETLGSGSARRLAEVVLRGLAAGPRA